MKTPQHFFTAVLLIFLSTNIGKGQGELMKEGQSGGTFLFSRVAQDKESLSSLSYTFTHKRKFEAGIGANKYSGRFSSQDATGFSVYAAAFINTKRLLNGKLFYTQSFNSRISASGFGMTLYANNSKTSSILVPTFTLLISEGNSIAYGPGLAFKFGTAFNIVGGLNYTIRKNSESVVGISFGVMFASEVTKIPSKE